MHDDRLKLIAYCPLCGSKPAQVDACALGVSAEKDTQLFHVTCRRCAAHMLTLTLVGSGSSGAIGLITDLSPEDAVRFARVSPISSDDVLRMHVQLNDGVFLAKIPSVPIQRSGPAPRRKTAVSTARRTAKRSRTSGPAKPRRSS